MSDEASFLKAICASPEDDLPRLVFTDWLEENGQPERAEFIRLAVEIERLGGYYGACREPHRDAIVGCGRCNACKITRRMDVLTGDGDQHGITANLQIAPQWSWSYRSYEHAAPWPEAVVRRGFVAEVRCTLADWRGGECGRCGGSGRWYRGGVDGGQCDYCDGSARTSGIGPDVVAAHPVTRVVLSEHAEPYLLDGCHVWLERDAAERNFPGLFGSATASPILPNPIFQAVWQSCREANRRISDRGRWVVFPTREDAIAALSTALIAWAKFQNEPKPPRGHHIYMLRPDTPLAAQL